MARRKRRKYGKRPLFRKKMWRPQKAAVTASREPADGENLVDLAVLADRHRVPSWMEAALCRMMGWEAGKRVTDAAYKSALDKLKARRLGGGRAR